MQQDPHLDKLIALGFDLSERVTGTKNCRVQCSQCNAAVVQGVAIHEHGCPNSGRKACKGCDTIVSRHQSYCNDCQ